MRAVFGLLLIMSGLALAVVWMPENDGERQLAVVTEIATQGLPGKSSKPPADERSARTFSPHTPLLAAVEPSEPGAQRSAIAVRIITPTTPIADPQVEMRSLQNAATVVAVPTASVVTGMVQPSPAASSGNTPARSSVVTQRAAPMESMPREELVRHLQRELRRVGCYHGEVDGSWGAGSKRAMGAFTDRVNASLPMEQPDFILLTLLQGQSGTVCGKACPAGQTLSDAGRCLPNAVIARASRGADRKSSETAISSRWTASVQREAADTPASSLRDNSNIAVAAGAALAGAAVAVTPLPGRMAMGGPQSGAGAFVAPPVDRSLARDAVRSAEGRESAREEAQPARQRSRRGASRRTVAAQAAPYAYRYYSVAPVAAYRPAPRAVTPRYYTATARRSSRSWTATFFGQ